jgi:hypothetical protein
VRVKHLLSLSAFFVAALLAAGCSTFKSRAKEKSAVYGSLDSATQSRIKARQIHLGDSEDMVYIAFGSPNERRETLDTSGRATTWVYNAYWQEYQGTRSTGYHRYVSYDAASKSYHVVNVPDYQPVYQSRSEERMRVTFKDSRVIIVEQVKTD